MKKLLSMALVVAMVMSLFCVVPASAAVAAVTVGETVGATTTIELEDYAEDIQDPTSIGFPEATAPKSTEKAECSGEAYLDYSSNNVAGYEVTTDFSRYMALDIALDVAKSGTYTLEILVDKNAYGNPHLYVGGEQLARTLRTTNSDVWASRSRYYNWTTTLYKGANTVQLRFNASGSATSAAWTLRADKLTVSLTEEKVVPVVGEAIDTEVLIELENYAADVKDPSGVTFPTATAPRSVDKAECSEGAYLAYSSNNVAGYDVTNDKSRYMSLNLAVDAAKGGEYTFEIRVDKNNYGNPDLYVGGEALARSLRASTNDVWTSSRTRYYTWSGTLSKGLNIVELRFHASGSATSAYWALSADYFSATLTEEIIEEEPREIPVVGTAVGATTTIELEDYANDVADPFSIGFPETTAPASVDKAECSGEAYLTYSSNNVAGYDVENDDFSKYMSLDIVVDAEKAGSYTFEICVDKNAYGNPHLYVGGEQLARTLRTSTSDIWANSRTRYYTWTGSLEEGENTVQLRFHASGNATSAYWAIRTDSFTVTLAEEAVEPPAPEVNAATTIAFDGETNNVVVTSAYVGSAKVIWVAYDANDKMTDWGISDALTLANTGSQTVNVPVDFVQGAKMKAMLWVDEVNCKPLTAFINK